MMFTILPDLKIIDTKLSTFSRENNAIKFLQGKVTYDRFKNISDVNCLYSSFLAFRVQYT